MGPGFIALFGSVSKIDKTDPSAVKIEVKDSRDNQLHIVEIPPAANIVRIADISEMKSGDGMRAMVRKAGDKEVAMGVMFGDMKKFPAPKPYPAQVPPGAKPPMPPAKETPKK